MSPLDTWGRVFQAEGTESAKALQTEHGDPGKLLRILCEGAACALESTRLIQSLATELCPTAST